MSPALGKGATTLRPDRARRERTTPPSPEKIARSQKRRVGRWQRRRQLRKVSSLARVRSCGHTVNPEGGVTLGVIENRDGTRSAAYGGLKSCGSVWSCPVCAAKIATRRADELATVMRAVDDAGGSAFLLTLTMRHARGDRLGLSREERRRRDVLEEHRADHAIAEANGWDVDERQAEADEIELETLRTREGCWDVLSYAWRSTTSGASWQADSERFGGLLGWARVVEATHGANGWHVHVHVLLCFADDVSADLAREAVGTRMFARWSRALSRRGFSASEEHGWDLRRAQVGDGDLADYFVKMAHEVTGNHRKEAKSHGGRTPMQLLADAVDTYRVEDLERWWEWETASDGRRQLTWSTGRRGLRSLAGLDQEATDQEIADEDQGADTVLAIEAALWRLLESTGQQCELLRAAEKDGACGAWSWCRTQLGSTKGLSVATVIWNNPSSVRR